MTRIFLLLIGWAFIAMQCETVVDPELSKIEGKWILYKIGVGYPAPNSPAEFIPTETETLEIDAKNKTLIRIVNGVVTESTKIEIGYNSKGAAYNPRLTLVFLESETYSFLGTDEAKEEISLYQKCPIGAELADGNTYFYKKP